MYQQPKPQKEEKKAPQIKTQEPITGGQPTIPLTDAELDNLFGTDVKVPEEEEAPAKGETPAEEVTLGKRRTWGGEPKKTAAG